MAASALLIQFGRDVGVRIVCQNLFVEFELLNQKLDSFTPILPLTIKRKRASFRLLRAHGTEFMSRTRAGSVF